MNFEASVLSPLRNLRGRLLLRILLQGVPRLMAVAAVVALLTFVLDYLLHTPKGVRIAFAVLAVGTLAWHATRHLFRPLRARPDIDTLALMVERSDPTLRHRLITAVQLETDLRRGELYEPEEFVRHHIERTAEELRGYRWGKAAPVFTNLKVAFVALVIALLPALLGSLRPVEASIWFERQILLTDAPWPRETNLRIEIPEIERFDPIRDGETVTLHVPERTPLQVRVRAEGVMPAEVTLFLESLEGGGRPQQLGMGRVNEQDFFQHIFPPLTRSLRFWVQGGDDDDRRPLFVVKVNQAPRVTEFRTRLDFPAYTGRADGEFDEANINAPVGTEIEMRFAVNLPLQSFALDFEKSGRVEVEEVPGEPGIYRHRFLLERSEFYTYDLRAKNGVRAADVPRYVITAQQDQAPRVDLERPKELDISVSANGVLPLLGRASDDYGISGVEVRWGPEPGRLDAGRLSLESGDLVEVDGPASLAFFRPLPIAELTAGTAEKTRPPQEGDVVHLGMLVRDNRSTPLQPSPQIVFGDITYRLSVQAPREIERILGQQQYGIRARVRRLVSNAEEILSATQELRAEVAGEVEVTDPSAWRAKLHTLEQEQNRLGYDLVTTRGLFERVFEGYLWNRLDPGRLTEALMRELGRAFREEPQIAPKDAIAAALEAVAAQIDPDQPMGRLARLEALFLRCSETNSPRAYRDLTQASLVRDEKERVNLLRSAASRQELLVRDLEEIEEKLKAWQEYLDLVQDLQELLEIGQGITQRLERLSDR